MIHDASFHISRGRDGEYNGGTVCFQNQNAFVRHLQRLYEDCLIPEKEAEMIRKNSVSVIFTYNLKGTGHYELFGGEKVASSPGWLHIWKPGIVRFFHHHDAGEYLSKYIAVPAVFFDILEYYELPHHIETGVSETIAFQFDFFANELKDQSDFTLSCIALRVMEFIIRTIRSAQNAAVGNFEKLETAARLLGEDSCERKSIQEIAAEVGMSYSSFRRKFVQLYRISPMEYRIRRRLGKIQDLLSTGRYQVQELAERFGYADMYVLSKQFKKYIGASPKNFCRKFMDL